MWIASVMQLLLLVAVSIPSWRRANVDRFAWFVGAAICLAMVAMALFSRRALVSGALSIVLANALLVCAHQLWLEALYRFCDIARGTRRFEAICAALCVGAVAICWGLDDSRGSSIWPSLAS